MRKYTKVEIAEQLLVLAACASEPEKSKLLSLASFFGRDQDLVRGSRKAITESKELIAHLDTLERTLIRAQASPEAARHK